MRTLLLSIFAVTLLAQPVPSPPNEKGSIEGVVVNQVTNAPIKKAQVTIAGAQVVTDAGGHFVVDQLRAGAYEVSAWHPNFPPPMRPSPSPNVHVILAPGEQKKDVAIALLPGVVISGKVLDEDGDPMSGCSVQVMRYVFQAGKKELGTIGGSAADDRGEYRIENLASGSFYLKTACRQPVRAPRPFGPKDAAVNLPEESYSDQFYAGSADAEGATKLKPTPGAELRDIDFRMRKQRSVSIHGKVTRPPGGDPREYVQVSAVPKNSSDRRAFRAARFEPSGDFEIHGVLPGSYWLMASNYDQESPLFGRIDLDVGDSPIHQVVLPMSPGFTLSGTVEMESPPSVLPPSPQPASPKAPNKRVWLFLLDGAGRFQRRQAEVQDDGAFSLSGVTPGDWQFSFGQLLPGTYIKSARYGDQNISPERFTIAQGGAGSLKIVIGANPGQIEGIVQLDNPQSAGAIIVNLRPDTASRPGFQQNIQTISDPLGHFSLQNIAPGRYRLCAFEQSSQLPQLADLLKTLGEEVTVEEGQHLTRQLKLVSPAAIADALQDLE